MAMVVAVDASIALSKTLSATSMRANVNVLPPGADYNVVLKAISALPTWSVSSANRTASAKSVVPMVAGNCVESVTITRTVLRTAFASAYPSARTGNAAQTIAAGPVVPAPLEWNVCLQGNAVLHPVWARFVVQMVVGALVEPVSLGRNARTVNASVPPVVRVRTAAQTAAAGPAGTVLEEPIAWVGNANPAIHRARAHLAPATMSGPTNALAIASTGASATKVTATSSLGN